MTHALTGVNGTGFVIVAIVALINATRRTINFVFSDPLTGWLLSFVDAFVSGLLMGSLILMGVVWTFNRSSLRGWRHYGAIAISVVVASGIGCVLTVAWETDGTLILDDRHSSLGGIVLLMGAVWLRYSLIGVLIACAWLYVRAEAEYVAALARCAIESARSDQQGAEARLQVLEAQIEPHFLFNTLAHVKRLYETDRVNGRRMLTNLMQYLSVALPQMRKAESTLGQEVAHAAAYLDIQKVRMGSRLAIDIEVPEALREATMPSLMILTLVENAIKHGIGPQAGGGCIAIRASAHEDRMKIEVADTGQGFVAASGGGTGLANIRGRLTAVFGGAASLSLTLNTPRGVIATIALPHCAHELPSVG